MPLDPSKPPDDPPRTAVRGNAQLRAVLVGIGIDICGTTLLDIVLTSLYVAQAGTPGMTSTQVDDLARSMPPQSPLAVLGILLGALISVAAGYVCARIARRGEYVVGALMAGGVAVISLLMSDTDSAPLDFVALSLASGIACNLLGVKYGVAQNRRLASLAEPPVDSPTP